MAGSCLLSYENLSPALTDVCRLASNGIEVGLQTVLASEQQVSSMEQAAWRSL